MSWRGQGGKRSRGRRGDQDPELDNTAWLAELEREAAQADEDEDDWASTLRSRRGGAGGPPVPQSPGYPAPAPPAGAAPSGHQPADAPAFDPAPAAADPDWAWRPADPDPYGEPPPGGSAFEAPPPGREELGSHGYQAAPEADWSDRGTGGWQPAGADAPTGAWSPADPLTADPGNPLGRGAGYRNGQEPGYADGGQPSPPSASDPGYAPGHGYAPDPGYGPGPDPAYPAASEPAYPDPPLAGREANYPTGYPEAREAEPPVGREPDYPALFGELYRRSAGQQDPIWEAPPPVEPLPETGPAEPVTGTWPFEETTQSWEPSDRSFIWPSDELPSAPAEWERPGPAPWDEPDPWPPARPDPPDPGLDQAAAWSAPAPPPAPVGPPPDDWAAAIPTDVPAARRAADSASATRMWRTGDPAEAEPGVPLGPGAVAPPGVGAAARTSRLRGSPGPGAGVTGPRPAQDPAAGAARTRPARRADARAPDRGSWDAEATTGYDTGAGPADEPVDIARKGSPRRRPAGERQARAWPRIIAIVSWIVLLMVFCWYYVFPWLERVLPENF